MSSLREIGMSLTPEIPEAPIRLTRADLMTADEVAVLLAVPVSTVHDWARRGLIPSRKLGRHRRFLRSEIEIWVRREIAV